MSWLERMARILRLDDPDREEASRAEEVRVVRAQLVRSVARAEREYNQRPNRINEHFLQDARRRLRDFNERYPV